MPDLHTAPRVVAVTSLSPDHLDWHGTVERYYADKLSLCTKPGVALALADGSDELLREQADLLGPHLRWVTADRGRARRRTGPHALGLPGPHNARERVHRPCRAGRPGDTRSGRRRPLIEGAAAGFGGLPSRCHSLGRVGAVEFVDDGLSTNVLPAQAALRAFEERPVALLVGGHDRGVDYAPLGRTIARRVAPTLVVTMPDNGPRIGAAVRDASGGAVEVIDASDLDAAVETAFGWAGSGARRAAVPGRAQLRPLRRLPGAVGRLRRRGRPLRPAQLSGVSRAQWPVPTPRAR